MTCAECRPIRRSAARDLAGTMSKASNEYAIEKARISSPRLTDMFFPSVVTRLDFAFVPELCSDSLRQIFLRYLTKWRQGKFFEYFETLGKFMLGDFLIHEKCDQLA